MKNLKLTKAVFKKLCSQERLCKSLVGKGEAYDKAYWQQVKYQTEVAIQLNVNPSDIFMFVKSFFKKSEKETLADRLYDYKVKKGTAFIYDDDLTWIG